MCPYYARPIWAIVCKWASIHMIVCNCILHYTAHTLGIHTWLHAGPYVDMQKPVSWCYGHCFEVEIQIHTQWKYKYKHKQEYKSIDWRWEQPLLYRYSKQDSCVRNLNRSWLRICQRRLSLVERSFGLFQRIPLSKVSPPTLQFANLYWVDFTWIIN